MCGSLRHSWMAGKDPLRVGDSFPPEVKVLVRNPGAFPVTYDEKEGPWQWQGHARGETLETGWKGWEKARVEGLAAYSESGREFDVADDEVAEAITRTLPDGTKALRVVTRQAEGREAQVHDRWPVLRKKA